MQYETQTQSPVVTQPLEVRSEFLTRVYQHLALAVAAFIGFEYLFFVTGIAERLFDFITASGGVAWLLILGGFMIVSWLVSRSAHNLDNPGMQYAALFGMSAAEALIFAPMLYFAFNSQGNGSSTVINAAIITIVGFGALSAVALFTKKDLSFLRPIVTWGFVAAIGLIAAALIFGFNLGTIFSVAMVALAGGAILYQTQNIYREYPSWAYVGAAVSLFGSLMTMFWYVLSILLDR